MIFSLTTISFGQNYLNAPEALTYHEESERYFVSNYDGTIVRIEKDGKHTQLVTGERTCSGAHIVGNILYANCGNPIQTIKGFNIETGEEVFALTISEAAYLNDIVSDENGEYLFVSDFNRNGGKIYKVNISKKNYTTYLDNLFKLTCGMIYEKENNRLMFMTGSGEKSLIQAANLSDKSISNLYTSTEYSAFDCLSKDNKGHYYVSSWRTNAIYSFDENFTEPEIVFTSGIVGPSGFEFIEKLDKIAAPSFHDNTIDYLPLPASYKESNLNVYEILLNTAKGKGIEETEKVFNNLITKYGSIYDFDEKMLNRVALKLLADKDYNNYVTVSNLKFKFYPNSKTLSEQILIALIIDNDEDFDKLSVDLLKNKKEKIDESYLNNIGYQLLAMPKINEAIKVFELNTKLFPNSGNVFDSYAEALMNKGENDLAIKNYKKSLELNPENENAVNMINQIKAKVTTERSDNKAGNFSKSEVDFFNNSSRHTTYLVDINSDNKLEIIIADFSGGSNELWFNQLSNK